MIQVRDTFQVKFGKIDQAIDLFKQLPIQMTDELKEGMQIELLSDISGPMYTLVEAISVPDLGTWTSLSERLFALPAFDNWFRQFQLFIAGGSREYFNLETPPKAWTGGGVCMVREVYRTYQWQIRAAVELLKRYGGLLVDRGVGRNPRILTDASGPMFTAVIEIETESVSVWESTRRDLFRQTEFQVWFNQMMTSVEAGRHEFYRVEYTRE